MTGFVEHLQVEDEAQGQNLLCKVSEESSGKEENVFLYRKGREAVYDALVDLLTAALIHDTRVRITYDPQDRMEKD
jgi:hypothetical protein